MFKDSNGQTSSMRVMAFMCLCTAIAFGYMVLSQTTPVTGTEVGFVGTYLAAAMGGKAFQKMSEK